METIPFSYAGLITVLIPFVTAKVKNLLPDKWRALVAPVLGAVAAVVIALLGGYDIATAIAIGVGAGGVGSSARDLVKDATTKTGGA